MVRETRTGDSSMDGRDVGSGAAALGAMVALALLAAPSGTSAQEAGDARWTAWLGCWSAVTESAEEPETGRGLPEGVLCLRPADEGPGVEVVDPAGAFEPGAIPADGRQRAVESDGCSGWERSGFSDDGRRVYLRSEYECPGGVDRSESGIMAFVSPHEWIDVRSVQVRGEASTWVRRYRVATQDEVAAAGLMHLVREETMARRAARMEVASAVGVDEVIEASDRVHSEAVSVWIAEQGDPFVGLDADALVRMEEAEVPGRVIDVVVAVTHPERFALSDGAVREREERPARASRRSYASSGRTIFYGGFGGWYTRPGHFWGSYYDPFLFPWAYYGVRRGSFYGYRPRIVYVTPRGEDRGGRVERGRGYVAPTDRAGSGDREARPRPDRTRGSGSSASRGDGGDRSSGGSVSRDDGYRSGGSSTGRRARPRSDDDGE